MGLALGLLREDFTRGKEGKAGPAEAAGGATVEAGAEPPGDGRGWGLRNKERQAMNEPLEHLEHPQGALWGESDGSKHYQEQQTDGTKDRASTQHPGL